MLPVLRDYVAYLRQQVPAGARRGLAVVITDSQLHDAAAVSAYSAQVAREVAAAARPASTSSSSAWASRSRSTDGGDLPRRVPRRGHLWRHRIAEGISQMAGLVAVLVDETMTVAAGGTVYDDKGNVLRAYESRLPAVLEFDVPPGCADFKLEVAGQRFTQPVPDEDDHDEDDGDHAPKPAPVAPPRAATATSIDNAPQKEQTSDPHRRRYQARRLGHRKGRPGRGAARTRPRLQA